MNGVAVFDEMFLPSATDMVDTILAEYRHERARCESLADYMSNSANSSVLHYFTTGKEVHSIGYLFAIEPAIAELNSAYWSKTLNLTDVFECMPQKRRDEWNEIIRNKKTPEFEETTVRATLDELLSMRPKYMAEKIDGVFQRLSRDHVTNIPEGFYKRMILNYACDEWGYANSSTAGYIDDLRSVIGKFMGRGGECRSSYSMVFKARQNPGEWMMLDGGAVRIRVYKKGTAHLEVHPDMAWRLNQMLASIHPTVIPTKHRERPKTIVQKEFGVLQNALSFEICQVLARIDLGYRKDPNWLIFDPSSTTNKFMGKAVENILKLLGGVQDEKSKTYWHFHYPVKEILQHISLTGVVPDYQSYQYYPTPEVIAKDAVEMLDIPDGVEVLEPSAGIGHIARFLPKDRTTCVELCPLFVKVLGTQEYKYVEEGDFLKFAKKCQTRYPRIIMNPPYNGGRIELHINAAFELLAANGNLVAVVPSTYNGKEIIKGKKHTYSKIYSNQFENTGIDVVIVRIDR